MKIAANEILLRVKDTLTGHSWSFTAPQNVQKSGFDTLRVAGSFSQNLWLLELGNTHYLTLPDQADNWAKRPAIAYFARAGFMTTFPHTMRLSNDDAEAYLTAHCRHEPETVRAFQHMRSVCDRPYRLRKFPVQPSRFVATPRS